MMAETVGHITLDMVIAELERQRAYFQDHYPALVKKRKLTPYERDHRININAKLLELLYEAKKNKATNGPKFLDLLNQLP